MSADPATAPRLLVVDDEEHITELLAMALGYQGFEVERAATGREALDSVATFTESAVHPHRIWRLVDGRPETFIADAIPWLPRQMLPPAYQLNGLVYCFRLDGLLDEGPGVLFGRMGSVLIEAERSIDIDNPLELDLANLTHARLKLQD